MRRLHHPAADVQRRADHAVGIRPLHSVHDADDVDDRVERADLVQVHLVDGHLMDRGFRVAEAAEHRFRALLPRRRQARVVDEMKNLGQAPVRMRVLAGAVLVTVVGVLVVVLRRQEGKPT